MRIKTVMAMLLAAVCSASAQFGGSPFSASANLEKTGTGYQVKVDFKVPAGAYLYKTTTKVTADPANVLIPEKIAQPGKFKDPASGEELEEYRHDFSFIYKVAEGAGFPIKLTVEYQGCKDGTCFLPQKDTFELAPAVIEASAGGSADSASAAGAASAAVDAGSTQTAVDLLSGFDIVATGSGYMSADKFMTFLDKVESGEVESGNPLKTLLAKKGILILILFILISGLALNLTPCVLPMIPINIAIIGAGTQAGSKARGFMLGAVYGLGIALSYGTLGLVVVLTGSQFGTLNSSPWFNLAIALIFALLALALFGVFRIDFSKFQAAGGGNKSRGPFITAFVFGALAALLAGACIAPVLIWVLLFSTEIYRHGNPAGLLLPFVLGLGMALPWPLAGAGLSFLPKPGKWMENINRVFGVIIMLAAIYYGWLGVKLLRPVESPAGEVQSVEHSGPLAWQTSLSRALKLSRESGKPVFVDCWATWCKNCEAMSATTLKNPEVVKRLQNYVPLKFQAENPKDPAIRKVLEFFGAKGLPFYVVLQPIKQKL